jgi:hypothetical protein
MTASWLESALGVEITSVEVEPIGEGAGFAGSVYRLRLEYEDSETGLPETLIWKTVSGDARTRGFLTTLGAYEREARFYGQLAGGVAISPRCHFSQFDAEEGTFCLLIEDVSYMKPGDQIEGCTFEEALAVIREVARLHSMFWAEQPDEELGWVPTFDGGSGYFKRMHSVAWRQLARTMERVPEGLIEAAQRIGPRVSDVKVWLSRPPVTLTHGDLRLDNVFFGRGPNADGIKLIDWQAIRRGKGAYDLAYFLSTSVPVEMRKLRQYELIGTYVETLIEGGVEGYSVEDCRKDFRWALLDIVTFVGVIGSTLDFQSDRGLELANTIMSRLSHALEDNSALDLLD